MHINSLAKLAVFKGSLLIFPHTDKILQISWNTGATFRNIYNETGDLVGEAENDKIIWKIFLNLRNGESSYIYFDDEGIPYKAVNPKTQKLQDLDVLLEQNISLSELINKTP